MRTTKTDTVIPTTGLLKQLSQHPVLPLLVASPAFRIEPPPELAHRMASPRRLSAHLLFYMVEGETTHDVDLKTITLKNGQVLCIQPNQIHRIGSGWPQSRRWYKLAFDEQCLSRLPRHFDFLDDPLGQGVFLANPRLGGCFEGLIQVLGGGPAASVDLVLAYMHVLLAEINDAYFQSALANASAMANATAPLTDDLKVFLRFKRLVEDSFAEQPPVHEMASAISVSEDRLYTIVRRLSGVSPKVFITRRTMLEAQRIFYYDRLPVKEVAYSLGFSDPDHFSRVFKKVTGKTVKTFLADLQVASNAPDSSSP